MKLFISFLIGLIIGFIIAQFYGFESKIITETELIRDTVSIIKTSEPIVMKKIIPKIIYQKDTVIVTKTFEARVDTIIKKDTIMLSYKFPENRFSYAFKPKNDTIAQIIRIEIPRPDNDCANKFLFAGIGLTAGIILSNLSK